MNDDLDKLKYRNETETLSRRHDYKVNDLYNESINNVKELYSSLDEYTECGCTAISCATSDPISWDSYFMNIAVLASLRSKDTTKVGAVITLNNKILGVGYNGFPAGIDESQLPTGRDGAWIDTKYPFVVHAELNAILNTVQHDISGSIVYVTLFPCCRCMGTLIQKRVSEIVYLSDKHHDEPEYVASRKLLSVSNINIRQYDGELLI